MDTRAAIAVADLARLRPYVRCAREEWRGPWTIAPRLICDYLLVMIESGRGRLQLGGAEHAIVPGEVVWLPPDLPHAMDGFGPRTRVLYAHFDLISSPQRLHGVPLPGGGMLDRGALARWMHRPMAIQPMAAWLGVLKPANATLVRDELRRLVAEDLGGRDPAIQAGGVLRLLGLLARGLAPRARSAGAHWRAMQDAAEAIRAAPEEAHHIRVLAAKARLSPAQFRRRFHEVHGMSPRDLLARARVEKARDLLLFAEAQAAIGAIAAAVGFASVHSLSRAFRAAFGYTPTAYRRARGEDLGGL